MNWLLRKEFRLLAPTWGVAVALILVAWLVAGEHSPVTSWREFVSGTLFFGFAPLFVMLMALQSVGRELDAGTFGQLLAQPVSRQRLWWTKTLLLAAACLSVWALWWFVFSQNASSPTNQVERREAFVSASLILLVAYAGGLWTVLVFRQVAAAFWFTFIIPAALASFTGYVCEKLGLAQHIMPFVVAVLVTYAFAGFALATRLFLHAQDAQWTGGEIALPGWLRLPRWPAATGSIPGRHPRRALWRKELQLHQSQFVIAGVLALVHLVVVAIRAPEADLRDNPTWQFAAYQLWVLWPIMALLIGCAAVAEERKLGTLEPQLCLPVRRRTQFGIKFGMALALSILFGVVAPAVFERGRILPELWTSDAAAQLPQQVGITGGGMNLAVLVAKALVPIAPFLPLLLVAVVLLGVSFYASTLARNTLQAIAPGILGIVVIGAVGFGLEVLADSSTPPWRGPLIYLIGVPTLTLTIAGLAYWNFKHVLVGWPVARRNLLTILATFLGVAAVTSAIYHRAWERFAQLEPAHGPARFTREQSPSMANPGGGSLMVRFPDGRLWQARLVYDDAPDAGGAPSLSSPQFLGGSNWMSSSTMPIHQTETAAIHADGSLWLIESPALAIIWTNGRPVRPPPSPSRFTRIGAATNWQAVIRQAWSPACLLLKTDGSLWQWGTNQFDFSKRATEKWPGLAAFEPQRFGTDSDWREMLWIGNSLYLWKTNGQAWVQNPVFRGPKQTPIELAPGFLVERYPEFDQFRWRSLSTGQPYQFGVRDNGTLWGFGLMVRAFEDPNVSSGQIGDDMNWLATACAQETAVALRGDGTLWKWNFAYRRHADPSAAMPKQLSAHRDWVGITGNWDGIIALAADGSLWHWRFEAMPTRLGEVHIPPLLAASRRPRALGNILESVP